MHVDTFHSQYGREAYQNPVISFGTVRSGSSLLFCKRDIFITIQLYHVFTILDYKFMVFS